MKKVKLKKGELADEPKIFEITGGVIKDDLCDYTFDIKSGIGKGDSHSVKGKGLIDDDLKDAMAKFNVHLASIDDVFKHSDVDIENINKMHSHELATLYHVTGFQIKGSEENESIILIGTKSIGSSGDRMTLKTPRITLDKLSSYEWHKELKKAVDNARNEVELYKGGKCTVVEETDMVDKNQLSIVDGMEDEEQFANAKLKD